MKGSSWSLDEFQKLFRAADAGAGPLPALAKLFSEGVKNPLVIGSAEPLRVERLISFLHERLFRGDPNALIGVSGNQLNGANDLSQFTGRLRTPSLFSGAQLFVIRNGEKLKAATEKSLAELFKAPIRDQLVVFTFEADSKKTLPLAALRELGTTVLIPELTGESLRRWMAKEVERFGIARGLQPDVAELLIRSFESELPALQNELQRLSLLAGKGALIELKHLQGANLPVQEQPSTELTKCIFRGDVRGAAAMLQNLLDSGMHPLQISGQLSKAFRVVIAGRGHDEPLHKDLNAPWLVRQIGDPRNLSEPELRRALDVLRDLDLQLKDSGLSAEDAISLAVEKLCRRKPAASARATISFPRSG